MPLAYSGVVENNIFTSHVAMENVLLQVLNQSALGGERGGGYQHNLLPNMHTSLTYSNGMDHALGCTSCPRGVHDKERVIERNLLKVQSRSKMIFQEIFIQHTKYNIIIIMHHISQHFVNERLFPRREEGYLDK